MATIVQHKLFLDFLTFLLSLLAKEMFTKYEVRSQREGTLWYPRSVLKD
jgi:hypothetical protein